MTSSQAFQLASPTETQALAQRVAAQIQPGDTVLLIGDLGMGKTAFARAVISTLCGVDDAPSPTYTIMQTYETAGGDPLWHVDLYRIEDPGELLELGLEDAFGAAVLLIEWPDRLGALVPEDRLEVELSAGLAGSDTARDVKLRGFGNWEGRIDEI